MPKIPLSVLVVIHNTAQRVLLLERAMQPGFWQSVTGSKDHIDEPWSQAAIREVAEETGIRIGHAGLPPSALRDWAHENVYEIYPIWRHRYGAGVTHNTERVFSLQVPVDTPVVLAPQEHVRYQWLAPHEAARLCFSPSNAQAILQLFEIFT